MERAGCGVASLHVFAQALNLVTQSSGGLPIRQSHSHSTTMSALATVAGRSQHTVRCVKKKTRFDSESTRIDTTMWFSGAAPLGASGDGCTGRERRKSLTTVPLKLPSYHSRQHPAAANHRFSTPTILYAAASGGHLNLARFLVEVAGVDVDETDPTGATPLLAAAANDHHLLVKLLLEHNADPHLAQKTTTDRRCLSPLQLASSLGHLATVRVLVRRESAVDRLNHRNRLGIALAEACGNGHEAVARCLVREGGADLAEPLLISVSTSVPTVATAHADASVATALMRAAHRGHIGVLRFLIAECGVLVYALHAACRDGRVDLVLLMLKFGIAVNAPDSQGQSPLDHAVKGLHVDVVRCLLPHCTEACVNRLDATGRTPLCVACSVGSLEIAQLLVRGGADVEARCIAICTPLHYASFHGNVNLVVFLTRECHTQINVVDEQGTTPLAMAARRGHLDVVKYLLQECQASLRVDCEVFSEGGSALYGACEEGHLDIVKFLIDQGEDPEQQQPGTLCMPIHVASYGGHVNVVAYLVSIGCEAEVEDFEGDTPLHLACFDGHTDVICYLIDVARVERQPSNHDGYSPLAYCVSAKARPAAEALAIRGAQPNAVDLSDPPKSVRPFLTGIKDRCPLQIAAACKRAADVYNMIATQPIDFSWSVRQNLIHLAKGPSPWGSNDHCAKTIRLTEMVALPWSPRRHLLYHDGVRRVVRILLLVQIRRRHCGGKATLPYLPLEMWFHVMSYVRRDHFPQIR